MWERKKILSSSVTVQILRSSQSRFCFFVKCLFRRGLLPSSDSDPEGAVGSTSLQWVREQYIDSQPDRQTDRQTSVYLYTSLTHKYIMHLYRVYELSSYKVYFKCSDTIMRYVMKKSLISTCDCHICMCTINLTHSGDESAGVASLSLSGKSSCMLRVSMTPVKKSPHRRTGGGT